ncbi:MAG TPA: ABC transporter permease [Bryobacteraceae bacterium]|jgi:predicted permease
MIEDFMGDFRHAWRMIGRMRLLAFGVIVSLGIGIGVNTALFSWMQALVLQPLPGVEDSGSYHLLEPRSDTGSYPGMSWLEYGDLRASLHSFRDIVAFRMTPLNVGEPDRLERTYALFVSGNYFSALGLHPALGRFIRPEEVLKPGADPVVVISNGYWKSHLAGAPDVIGRELRINDYQLRIIGVAPEAFQGTVIGLNFDLWVPATLAPSLLSGSRELEDRSIRGYSAMAMLAPHVSNAEAQAELSASMTQLAKAYPETNSAMHAEVLPFWSSPRGPQRMLVRALAILEGLMFILLLAVCGNTANLVLARASSRQREIGIRRAVGAGSWRLASLLLSETLVLGILGAILGAAIAAWGTVALRAVPLSTAFPIRFQTGVDAGGLAFAMLLGILCGLLAGAAPAIYLSHVDPHVALRAGSNSAVRTRSRNMLMGAEVALALIVLMAAALFYRSFREGRESDPGFRRDGVLLAGYDFTGRKNDPASMRTFAIRMLEQLRALPDVEEAAIASSVPLDIHGMPVRAFKIPGRQRNDAAPDQALYDIVTPGYFATMGIPLLSGTDFAALDDAAATPQMIVNQEFVRRYLDGAEPIGREIEAGSRSYRIVGVARNSLYDSFGEPPTPIIYYSFRDRPLIGGQIHVRRRGGGESGLAPELRRVAREVDPALPIYEVRTLNEHLETNLFLRRIPARMFMALGPLLLVLAAIGIYAVTAYNVARQTAEIGLRLALGATGRRVAADFVRSSLRVVGIGIGIGWSVVFIVAIHLMHGKPLDGVVLFGVPLVLFIASAIACWLPARRAVAMDPMIALRQE